MNQDTVKNTQAVILKNAGFIYPGDVVALQNIDLEIDKGEKVGIIGPNGSGKSTLMSLLNGSRYGTGDILINGTEVNPKTDKQIKSMVGLVFQNPEDQLFCPKIFDDVAFGPANYGINGNQLEKQVSDALAEVGLEGYENRSSDHLSFGEKKLASIASIISMQPKIIALDEPVSNLDHAHRRKIINWINQSNRTFIITSHDLEMLLEVCQRVFILNNGKKIADGRIQEILSDEKLLNNNNLEQPISLKKC
jgi:cobalt/nickel transport system ATP-binding protein